MDVVGVKGEVVLGKVKLGKDGGVVFLVQGVNGNGLSVGFVK